MPAVSGPRYLSDPDGGAERFAAQLKSEAAAPQPKTGRWPNVTGWAEQRQAQRIYAPELERLRADGVPDEEARERAREFARAEMLTGAAARNRNVIDDE